jgi:hypothetical protein
MNNTPLKDQAEQIITSVEHDLTEVDTQPMAVQTSVDGQANKIVNTIFNVIGDVDVASATARVEALVKKYPHLSRDELSQMLIRDKCQRTGTIGAVTASAGIVPGIGTAAAITLGTAADIGMTFKLQAELVLEIAALYEYPLTEDEKQRLVMVITGISAGTTTLARKAGQNLSVRIGEKFAERAAGRTILKAIPWIGIAASAGTNVLSTYIIGQRADTYFRLGPEAVGTWADTLRTVSGVDERKIASWVADSGKATGAAIASGAGMVGQAGKAAGGALVSGAGTVGQAGKAAGGALVSGAGTVGGAVGGSSKRAAGKLRRGIPSVVGGISGVLGRIFRFVGQILLLVLAVITFVPRKILGFRPRRRTAEADAVRQTPARSADSPEKTFNSAEDNESNQTISA